MGIPEDSQDFGRGFPTDSQGFARLWERICGDLQGFARIHKTLGEDS